MRNICCCLATSDTQAKPFGVSVVEESYSRIIPRSLLLSVGITVLCIILVLFGIFRNVWVVAVAMSGVSFATPVTLAVMERMGQEITIFNSMIPTMILIIGVADAIHMIQAYRRYVMATGLRRRGQRRIVRPH